MASDRYIAQEHEAKMHEDQKITDKKAPFQDGLPNAEANAKEETYAEAFATKNANPEIDSPKSLDRETDVEMAEDANASAFDDLANRLMLAEQKTEEHRDNLLRLQAEMENLRKRSAREIENAHKYGLDRFVSELLPVKDSLELGISAATDEKTNTAAIREGMELTLKMFQSAMEKFGIEEVAPAQGERFDPERHQAMSVQEDKNKESGTVSMVVQKGYLLNGRLVRPAMVIVVK
uniref:Protein GrpE n=1 Tax=Candidatus Kentrum sp. MB TaxID=2138164 RepID=A0A451B7N4_9GAMM|nr:MAG: molecular chaperone GrpE [Candidatus Kentron sp. MB]VFK74291.1 MAG: molecular chaperone GrpE [Candidatus Kentron sp. MB]